jgi:hypothetical protein
MRFRSRGSCGNNSISSVKFDSKDEEKMKKSYCSYSNA